MHVFKAMQVDLSFLKQTRVTFQNLSKNLSNMSYFVEQMSSLIWPFNMMSFGERIIRMACILFNKLQLV